MTVSTFVYDVVGSILLRVINRGVNCKQINNSHKYLLHALYVRKSLSYFNKELEYLSISIVSTLWKSSFYCVSLLEALNVRQGRQ